MRFDYGAFWAVMAAAFASVAVILAIAAALTGNHEFYIAAAFPGASAVVSLFSCAVANS